MSALKVRKQGGSLSVTIPKDVAIKANMNEGDSLYPSVEADGSVVLRPYDPEFERRMETIRKVIAKNPNALRELAK